MKTKQYYYIRFLIVMLLFFTSLFLNANSVKKWSTEDHSICFKIDSAKLNTAIELVKSYEDSLKNGDFSNKTVIKGISLTEIIHDLKLILKYPNANILGARGRYCGPAAIFNWLINNKPSEYIKVVFELCYYGKTKFKKKGPTIKLARILHKLDYSITDTINNTFIRVDTDSTRLPDFIFGVSLVCSEKFIQKIGLLFPRATYDKYSVGSFIFSNTMPWEINDYMRKLNIKLDDKGYYLGDKENIKNLKLLEEAVKSGKMPIILENHILSFGQTQNCLYAFTGVHFITMHSFNLDMENEIVNYTYWDYGSIKDNPYKRKDYIPEWISSLKKQMKHAKKVARSKKPDFYKKEVSFDKFLKAMKGYWIPE